MTIPLMLTLLRILVIPFIVICYLLPFSWAHPLAAVLFALAGFTDWLDGYLARSWSQTTQLGAFLDPVADKLLVAVSLVMILDAHLIPYLGIAAAVIVGREIAVSALREWMAAIGSRAGVAVTHVAKYKTAIQMLAMTLLMWYHPDTIFPWIKYPATLLLYIAAVLTLWSMCIYLKAAWPDFERAS